MRCRVEVSRVEKRPYFVRLEQSRGNPKLEGDLSLKQEGTFKAEFDLRGKTIKDMRME